MFKKQMPTLLGLALLIVGLVAAAILFSQGTGIFLPRATPETTPKNVRVSNITEDGFYITFLTDSEVPGFVRYGTKEGDYTQIGDERDQLSGQVGSYQLHQIRVKGLQAGTNYFYVIGTGNGALFDDNGEPFVIKTAVAVGTQPKVNSAYGTLKLANGSPAEGWVVFVTTGDAGTQSSLVRDTGSWAIALSNARKRDGSGFAEIKDGDILNIQVQGPRPNDTMQAEAMLEADKPIELVFGSDKPVLPSSSEEASASAEEVVEEVPSDVPDAESGTLIANEGEEATEASSASDSAEPITTLDLTQIAETDPHPVVETSQPIITGSAPANLVITIEVNSETKVNTQVNSDENGNFTVDIAALSANLEPGEHSIKYSYVDPATGQTVTKTQTFVVRPKAQFAQAATPAPTQSTSTQIAQAQVPTPTPLPFGTNNPVPITSPTPMPTESPLPTAPVATVSPTLTASGSGTATTGGQLIASGSVGTTALLLGGGLFFVISAVWSWWIARELQGNVA